MAKVNYEKVYKQLLEEEESRKSALKKTDKKANVQSQIDNITTRMKASGVDVDKETDKRNPVEKFLGLPEDQGIIRDFFELLGRPQQALFGAWKENQDGGDLGDSLSAAWKHFKGDDETKFKEILKDNRLGWEFEDEKGKADLVDWLGFAGDVLLDPADWPFIIAAPATGGASLLGLADNVVDASRAADNAIDAVTAAAKAADAAKSAKVVRKSISDLAFEGVGKAVKGATKLADSGLTNTLKYLDETKGVVNKVDNLSSKADEVVKIGYANKKAMTASDLGKYVRNADELENSLKAIPKGRLEAYVDLKESISNIFKLKGKTKDAIKAATKSDFLADTTKKRVGKVLNEYADDVAASADEIGMSAEKINEAMTDMIEYKGLNRVHKGSEIIEAARKGALAATDDNIKIIEEIASDVNNAGRTIGGKPFKLGYSTDNGVIRLDSNWSNKALSNVDEGAISLSPEMLAKEFTLSSNYTDEQLEYLNKLENNKAFMNFYEKHKDLTVKLNKIIDEEFGKNFIEKFGDNIGYVPHSYTGFATNSNINGLLDADSIIFAGNKSILSDRTRLGSVLEENTLNSEILTKNYDKLDDVQKKFVDNNKDIFERNYAAALSKKYMDELPTLLKNDSKMTEILVSQSFEDLDEMFKLDKSIRDASIAGNKDKMMSLAEEYNKRYGNSNIKAVGQNGEVPQGYTVLTQSVADDLADKLETLAKQLGNGDVSKVTSQIRKYGDKKVAVDNYVLNLIGVMSESARPMGRLTDWYLNFYKKWKVASPTYLLNNLTGNMSNLWLSGINVSDQVKYFPDAYRIFNEGQSLMMRKHAGELLSATDSRIADLYEMMAKEGFGNPNVTAELLDMPECVKKYLRGDHRPSTIKEMISDGIPYLTNKANTTMDTMSRAVVMLKSLDDPNYLAKLGVDNYADAIRKVMFDPKELTMFEREKLTKYIPFYTFAKKNLAYQIDNLGKNGGRYHRLMKTMEGLQDLATDGNSDNMEEYLKNNLYIPIPGVGKDGSYTVLRTQLPFGNLLDLSTDPLGGIVNMAGPIKAIPEFVMNKNMFTGADIEKYPGEMSKNIPFLTKKMEHALGSFTGLDVPLKTGFRVLNGIQDTMNNGGTFFEGLGNGALNTVTMEQNINTDELSRMYDELDELEMLMQQYKGMGYEFATINELKKANPNATTNRIMAQLNKMSNIDTEPFEYFSDGSTFR